MRVDSTLAELAETSVRYRFIQRRGFSLLLLVTLALLALSWGGGMVRLRSDSLVTFWNSTWTGMARTTHYRAARRGAGNEGREGQGRRGTSFRQWPPGRGPESSARSQYYDGNWWQSICHQADCRCLWMLRVDGGGKGNGTMRGWGWCRRRALPVSVRSSRSPTSVTCLRFLSGRSGGGRGA